MMEKLLIKFQDIVESLSFLADSSPEVHAEWTIKLITGKAADQFLFPVRSESGCEIQGLNSDRTKYVGAYF